MAAKPVAFDPVKATNAYLARVSGADRAKSDSYFEGGYVLLFVDAFYAIGISALLLWFRVSALIRDFAERQTRSRFWQVPIYSGIYIIVTTLLTFPLSLYEQFFREKSYGLLNQSFGGWLGDFATGFGLNIVGGTIVLTLIYAAIRSAPRTWWVWGALLTLVFGGILLVISPVFIDPLFNHYSPLPDSPLERSILSLARANGIPTQNVWLVDASRQSDRISANVSGFLGTTRVALNDNLLHKGTPDEVLAVLGHEMGHYVLDHSFLLLLEFGLVGAARIRLRQLGLSDSREHFRRQLGCPDG